MCQEQLEYGSQQDRIDSTMCQLIIIQEEGKQNGRAASTHCGALRRFHSSRKGVFRAWSSFGTTKEKEKKKRQVFMEGNKDDGTELFVVLYRHISATGLPAPMTGKCAVAWSSTETGHYWIGLGWPASNMEPPRPLPALFALLGDGERRAVCDGEVGNMEEWRCECMLERDELEMHWR